MIKQAYIKEISDGKWRVFSQKGKNLGTFPSKSKAEDRLKQVEMFKHMKNKRIKRKSETTNSWKKICLAIDSASYSGTMRDLREDGDSKKTKMFQAAFKENFEKALEENSDDPEDIALMSAIKSINMNSAERMYKLAAATIQMGEPASAGKGIAEIVKFLVQRISPESRSKSLQNLRKKIWNLNEHQIAGKKVPASASLGQSITFIKTILIGHDPRYIRDILKHIVINL